MGSADHNIERAQGALDHALATFYTAVSRATVFGNFKGHHGPLEETAWLHVAIHELEQADRLAIGVLDQDVRYLARLRTIFDGMRDAPSLHAFGTVDCSVSLEGRQPAIVATAALLLDRLTDSDRYFERAKNYYADRAARIQLALERAAEVVEGRSRIDQFGPYVSSLNPSPGMSHAQHAAQPPSTHVDTEHAAALSDADAKHSGHEHQAVGRVYSAFAAVMESGAHTHEDPSDVIGAACHCDGLSTAAHAKLEALSLYLRGNHGSWRDFLKERPRPIDLKLPEPERRHRCVPGQPQFGGQWGIPSLRVTETDERCLLGQMLYGAGSKVHGHAGDQLIKGQNEWIKAKECFGDANKKKGNCIKEEDHSYNRCDTEEDQGYSRCDREEDRGHRECCDWWPCSWACDAWTWFKKMVCVASTWIEHWVCIAWTWIKKIVCVAWAYVVAAGCAIGHVAKAAVHVGLGLGGVLLGSALKTIGNFVGNLCAAFGAKPRSREATRLNVVGVHTALLHTNKVLLFSYDEGNYPVSASNPADFTAIGDSDRAQCAVWDFTNGTAHYIKLKRNLFCAHQAFTADGRLLVAGGQFPLPGLLKSLLLPELLAPGADKDLHLFDPTTETWTRLTDMAKGRWYPTCVTLADGRVFISSGTNGWATEAGLGRGIQDTWQIANPITGDPGTPMAFGFHLYHLFPFQHVLPSGEVFIHFKRTTVLFNPATSEMVRVAARNASSKQTGRTQHPYSRTGGGPGTCVLLPLVPTFEARAGAVTYPAARILILGGGTAEKEPEPSDPTDDEVRPEDGTTGYHLHSSTPATNTAEILDFASPDPQWRYTKEPMQHPRVIVDSVLLPNGRVLVVGGGRFGQSGGLLAHFTSTETGGTPDKGATDPVMEPELFDPETETWETLCPKPVKRLYHTSALLLPDARVLVAGHDGALNMPPYDSSQYGLEVFSPPYLFGPDGKPALRPVVVEAPDSARLAARFGIRVSAASAIRSIVLIRQSCTTHQINSDQRFVGLAIVGAGEDRHEVQMPAAAGITPPGYYMLFAVDAAGVPSVAHWLRVTP
jgi:Galactose oxidase-like, Early set domain/Glyoxal oxidase N-terminus